MITPTNSRSPAHHGLPAGFWVLGTVALAAAIPWAIFGTLGWTTKSSLDSNCAGYCPSGQIDDVHRDFLIADISAGVTLAAVATAILVAVLVKPHAATHVGLLHLSF